MTPSQSERHERRISALHQMVLSASGWRTVCADDDHSTSPSIAAELRDITAVATDAYLRTVTDPVAEPRHRTPTIVVATDSRPTGPAIADTVLRVCLSRGIEVRWLKVSPTPEALAYVATDPRIDGFFYISASHNPPGHNGFKMGYSDGAVMPGEKAWPLIGAFRSLLEDWEYVDSLIHTIAAIEPHRLAQLERENFSYQEKARAAYRTFALDCSAGRLGRDRFFQEMQRRLNQRPLGVVGEFNGSARSSSIDRTLLPELGIALAVYNDTPGVFSHQILPEGVGLEEAGTLLKKHGIQDPAFQIAYVPDNDGDRGNLVFLEDGAPVFLDAQTVFAMVVMTELAWARYLEREQDEPFPPLAVVANGPTSSRIDEICASFGARLYRAEVGEANVVNLAEELQSQGLHVVVLGEGSNGGNITPPSTVRDPLSTILAMAKLRAFSLYETLNTVDSPAPDGYVKIAASLPAYSTLPTDDPRAKMQIGTVTHANLKRSYERLLPDHLPYLEKRLSVEYGGDIAWRIHNYEGTADRQGVGARTGEERGGLKVEFYRSSPEEQEEDCALAFVWMRGSGTEPVYRILADCRGSNQEALDDMVAWQRDLVSAAVQAAAVHSE